MGIIDLIKKKIGASDSPSLLERWEVQSALKECCEKKVTATVLIHEYPLEFLSLFLNANPDNKWITIDLLKPDLGNRYIEKSKSIQVLYNLNGMKYTFRSSYIEETNNEYRAIKISYPKKINNTQRRQYFRVEPPIEDTILISAKVYKESPYELKGPMRDISEGGISFIIGKESAVKVALGDILDHLCINLPGPGEIITRGAVRSVFEGRGNKFICGIEFLGLTDDQISRIYRYVVERQKDTIKRLGKVKL